jgi:hypothetical protein
MLTGGFFPQSITALSLNCTSSQPSISTGAEPELWRAVGSELHMVEGRYHMTALIQFYPVFFTPIKIMTEKAKLYSPSSYL